MYDFGMYQCIPAVCTIKCSSKILSFFSLNGVRTFLDDEGRFGRYLAAFDVEMCNKTMGSYILIDLFQWKQEHWSFQQPYMII